MFNVSAQGVSAFQGRALFRAWVLTQGNMVISSVFQFMLVIHLSHMGHVFNIFYPNQTLQIALQYIAKSFF